MVKRLPKPTQRTECEGVVGSYEKVKKACIAKVDQIIQECESINQKYSDPYFDLDDQNRCINCLSAPVAEDESASDSSTGAVYGLIRDDVTAGKIQLYGPDQPQYVSSPSPPLMPASIKRVTDIFDNPRFYVDGVNAKDIQQGYDGDCWFLSALAAICNLEPSRDFIERVCVAQNVEVGVYGFVFYRDGSWFSVIIDDKLYLLKPDYEDADTNTRMTWEENRVRVSAEEMYRRAFQSNSQALFYAHSSHPDETWVPLMEKAYAKAHGDYGAIDGGLVSEGIEDLTGGVSSMVYSSDILSKDRFWKEGLLKVNSEFLFGCGTPDWEDDIGPGRDGIHGNHAYSILKACEYESEKLVLVKNPWGRSEWNGPWSDGSKEWTLDAMQALSHTFGDDGIFWIRYSDLLKKYDVIFRTRLFTSDWCVSQQWTNLAVPWAGYFQDVKFNISVPTKAPMVIILSQLDDRYFRGLEGQYRVTLSFRTYKAGQENYIMRTVGEYPGQRSVSVELTLDAGEYEVRPKISAYRDLSRAKIEDVIQANWLSRREKLLQIGLSYDLSHAKGIPEASATKDAPTPAQPTTTAESVLPAPTGESVVAPPVEAATSDSSSAVMVEGDQSGAPPVAGASAADAAPEAQKEETAVEPDTTTTSGEPWFATCVVGLRVYAQGTNAKIRLSSADDALATAQETNLDVDDPAKVMPTA
ncbi:hypothetical protein MMC25_001569 [Agyrium rufum]|nr:hypothetical protein [Agyrium rufum]